MPGATGSASAARRAFTLIELLVVMVIIVTLVALAAGALRRSPADRINSSARQLQSRILLARSMALRDQRVTGLRLVQSANDPWVVDTVEVIASPGYVRGQLTSITNPGGKWLIAGSFHRLVPPPLNPNGRGLIRPGSRIEIPEGSGRWYTVRIPEDFNQNGVFDAGEQDLDSSGGPPNYIPNVLVLDGHYSPSTWDSGAGNYVAQPSTNIPYRLELAHTVTAGEEPLRLQPGTVIDLAACDNVPASLEILFAPGQGLTGGSAAGGNIYLYITTLEDVELTRNMLSPHPGDGPLDLSLPALPIVPANAPNVPKTEPAALTIYAQTGNVLSVPVDLSVASPPPYEADDPYSYARRGKELSR